MQTACIRCPDSSQNGTEEFTPSLYAGNQSRDQTIRSLHSFFILLKPPCLTFGKGDPGKAGRIRPFLSRTRSKLSSRARMLMLCNTNGIRSNRNDPVPSEKTETLQARFARDFFRMFPAAPPSTRTARHIAQGKQKRPGISARPRDVRSLQEQKIRSTNP